ncbi:DUF7557 family protein [Nitrosopumilus sp.]|nr:hypothetical protein [Nitrosopumilus sp.]
MVTNPKYEDIPVFIATKKSIDEFGRKNETYDDVINRLLSIAEEVQST